MFPISHTPHLMYTRCFCQFKHLTPSHLPAAVVHFSVPRASPKGSPSTEGCCKGNLEGQCQQTLPWKCLCEMQARPQPCCGADKKPTASQGRSPASPRLHGWRHPCPHKVLTLQLSDAMLLSVLVFVPLLSTHTSGVTPARAAFWVPMPATSLDHHLIQSSALFDEMSTENQIIYM